MVSIKLMKTAKVGFHFPNSRNLENPEFLDSYNLGSNENLDKKTSIQCLTWSKTMINRDRADNSLEQQEYSPLI